MKKLLLLTILILITANVSALEISSIEFLSRGQPIGMITTGKVPNIDLKIIVEGENFNMMEADISGLHKNDAYTRTYNYGQKIVQATGCIHNSTTNKYECYIHGLELQLPGERVDMNFKLYDNTGFKEVNKTHTFNIDDTKPLIVSIKTPNCINNDCYIASGIWTDVLVEVQDSRGSFDKKMIRYSLNSKHDYVKECSGGSCQGLSKVTCNSESLVSAQVLSSDVMDDAYNRASNSLKTTFICDSKKPVIENITVEGSSSPDYIKIGDTIIVKVIVTDDIGPVSGTANFSKFGGTTEQKDCELRGDVWACIFSSKVFGEEPYKAKVDLEISDFAGNKLKTTTEEIEILGIEENYEPNYWDLTYDYSPKIINKQMIPYTQKKVYMHSKLTPRTDDLTILSMWFSDCQSTNGDNYLAYNLPEFFTATYDNQEPVVLYELMQSTGLPESLNKIQINCTLNIQTQKETSIGNFFISNPERENVSITIQLTNLQSPEKLIEKEIEKQINKTLKFQKKWGLINNIFLIGKNVCQSANALNTAGGLLSSTAAGFHTAGVKGVANEISKMGTGAGVTSDSLLGNEILNSACKFSLCNLEINEEIKDVFNKIPLADEFAKAAGYDDASSFIDPDNSIILSAATLCLPSFLYNLQKLRAINCEYTRCLTNDFVYGQIPISECADIKAYQTCRYWWGEVFQVIPHTAVMDELFDFAEQTISDPVNLVGTSLSILCLKVDAVKGGWFETTCNLAASIKKVSTMITGLKNIPDMTTQYQPATVCDQMLSEIDDRETNRYREIQDAKGPVVGTTPNCDVSSCRTKDSNGQEYMIIGIETETETDRRVNYFYKKEGDSYKQIDGDELPNEVIKNLISSRNHWQDTFNNVRSGVKNEYARYMESYKESVEAQNEYHEHLNKYNSFRDLTSDYDRIEKTQTRYERRIKFLENLPFTDDAVNNLNKNINDLKAEKQEISEEIQLFATEHYDTSDISLKQTDGGIIILSDESKETILDDLKENYKDSLKDYKEKQKKAEKDFSTAITHDVFKANWRNADGWANWKTTINTVRGFNRLSAFLWPKGSIPVWKEKVSSMFHNTITDSEYRKSVICESKLTKKDTSEIAFVASGFFSRSVGANIQAERSPPYIDDEGEELYEYTIKGVVAPSKPGLNFNILLDDMIIYKGRTNETVQSFYFIKDNVIIYETTNEYSAVCLEFKGDWKQYFELVHSSEKNKLCNEIVEVEFI